MEEFEEPLFLRPDAFVSCPICQGQFHVDEIEYHVSQHFEVDGIDSEPMEPENNHFVSDGGYDFKEKHIQNEIQDPSFLSSSSTSEKFQVPSSPGFLSETQNERLFLEFMRTDSEGLESSGTMSCPVCQSHVPIEDLIFDFPGERVSCKTCLRKEFDTSIRNGFTEVFVPGTDPEDVLVVPEQVLRSIFSESDVERLRNAFMEKLQGSNSLVKCPSCELAFESVGGSTDGLPEKDDQGRVLDQLARQHAANHRFRCPRCTKVFCSGCNAIPYHLGSDCDGYLQQQSGRHCRFCEEQLNPSNIANIFSPQGDLYPPSLADCCSSEYCLDRRENSCSHALSCGHFCRGIKGESEHLHCLNCPDEDGNMLGEEFCMICYCESLYLAPCIKLHCGHVFHFHCIQDKIAAGYPGPSISFGFLECPMCKKIMEHPAISDITEQWRTLYDIVREKAVERIELEGEQNAPQLTDPSAKYYNDPIGFALKRYRFYECHSCKKPYYGGKRDCEAADDNRQVNKEDLICPQCCPLGVENCSVHGNEYIIWKCKFCCNPAAFFCWGTTHFCDPCHERQNKGDYMTRYSRDELPACPGKGSCPFAPHPLAGEEWCIGCAMCLREAQRL